MWVGMTLTTLMAGAVGLVCVQNNKAPALGVVNGRFKPLSWKPNGVSTQASEPAKQVAPWPMKATAEQTLEALVSTINSYGGAEIKAQTRDYLYVVFTSPLLRFHDDAEFYLDQASGQVHFRSASRSGHSDLGLNRKRFDKLTELYQR